jgi:hypothetical protein
MITMRRQLMGLGFIAASSLLALHAANAMNGPTAITVDGGPIGELSVSGGIDGYAYYQTPYAQHTDGGFLKEDGASVANMQIDIQKTTGVIQFNIEAADTGGSTALGVGFSPIGYFGTHFYTTGNPEEESGLGGGAKYKPLYLANITIAPPGSPITISAGEIGSVEGYEGTFDWGNPTQFTSDAWWVENSSSQGVALNYTFGNLSGSVSFGDGFPADDGVFNFVQAIANYTFSPTNTLSVFYAGAVGTTSVYTDPGNQFYKNSQMVGFFDSYTMGNLNLVPEVQYVYAKADSKIFLAKPTWNFAALVLADYSFGTSPYSIGGMAEYFASHTSVEDASDWYLGPDADGIGVAAAPTWQYKDIFARANFGFVYLTNNKFAGGKVTPFGDNGRTSFESTLEAGLLF